MRGPCTRGQVRATRSLGGLFALILAAGLPACDSFGGGTAEVEIRVVNAVPDPLPPDGWQGTVHLRLRAALSEGSGFPVNVTGGTRQAQVDLDSGEPVLVGSFRMGTGIYQGFTLVLSEVRAELTGGPGVGEGPGLVTVDLGSDGVLILERESSLGLRDGARLLVTLELGAREWLEVGAPQPLPRSVPEAALEDGLSLSLVLE